MNEPYWGKPVPGFGDPEAELFILGLAPAAHGANRTGRMFTGDRSGEWLYAALHKAGFANQATFESRGDGLKLKDAFVTATARCAPPDNKPTRSEIANCAPFLEWELKHFKRTRVYLVLGKIAFDQMWKTLNRVEKKPVFKHGALVDLGEGKWLLCSYHPSQQNTFTGRLTNKMFDSIFTKAKELVTS